MAKAVSNVKRVKIEGDITLTLSPEEAIFLKALLSMTVEYDRHGDSEQSQHVTAERYSKAIWTALDVAKIPSVDGSQIFIDSELELEEDSLQVIEGALAQF